MTIAYCLSQLRERVPIGDHREKKKSDRQTVAVLPDGLRGPHVSLEEDASSDSFPNILRHLISIALSLCCLCSSGENINSRKSKTKISRVRK